MMCIPGVEELHIHRLGCKAHVGLQMSILHAWPESGPMPLHEAGAGAGCLVYPVDGG